MSNYRIFVKDKTGHIVAAHVVDVPDDDTATERAKQYVDGCDVEVWELKRMVAHLTHDDPLK